MAHRAVALSSVALALGVSPCRAATAEAELSGGRIGTPLTAVQALPVLPVLNVGIAPFAPLAPSPAPLAAPAAPHAETLPAAAVRAAAAAPVAAVPASAPPVAKTEDASFDAPAAAARLEKAGYAPSEAREIAARFDERMTRVSALLREQADDWLPHGIKNAEVLSMLLGARPALLTKREPGEREALPLAARLVDPRARAVQVAPHDRSGYVFVYNPEQVVAAMREATRDGARNVSFAKELKAMDRSGEAPSEWIHRWLEGWLEPLSRNSVDSRVGILLGYPHRDVSDLIKGRSGAPDEPMGIDVPYGAPGNAVHWLTSNFRHAQIRKAVALYETAFAMAASRIGAPQSVSSVQPSRETLDRLRAADRAIP